MVTIVILQVTLVVFFSISSHEIVSSPSTSVNLKQLWAQQFNRTIAGKCFKEITLPPSKQDEAEPVLSVIEMCCEGFKPYDYDPSKCVPDCPEGCENGFCIAPNVCNCYTDHVRSYDNKCVPTCPISCLNGYCHSNGTCTCNPRHILEPLKKFCLPICNRNCGPRMYCSAPGLCSCQQGYVENARGQCEPVCSLRCLHGECLRPGVCACEPGYVLKDKVCQANCSNCANGKCVASNVCSCNPGYTFDLTQDKCVPVCERCFNGVCISPGICECNEGYQRIENTCKPACKGGCSNGHCVEPEICNCREGYARNIFGQCKRLTCFRLDELKSDCVIKHIG